MKNLCQEYIANVKSFFPVLGKEERKYLAKLKNTVEDYCNEENITTIDKLYDGFGLPNDVVNSYYSNTDIQEVIKQIRLTKYIKRSIAVFLFILLIGVIAFSINTYHTYKIFSEQQVHFIEEIITD